MNDPSYEQDLCARLFEKPDSTWVEFWGYVLPVARSKVSLFNLSHEDTEDVLSELAFRLSKNDFKTLRNWDPLRCPLKGYLAVVAKSAVLDFLDSAYFRYNRVKATPPVGCEGETLDLLDTLENQDLSPAERMDRFQLQETICGVIDSWAQEGGLKPQEEGILKLRLQAVPFAEIAEILGISQENAMTKFHRLKENFGKRLQRAGIAV